MSPTPPTVVVFARRPVPGQAKSRISAALGVEATHRLYQAMLHDTFRNVAASGLRGLLVHTPGPWPEAPWPTTWQRGDSFAERFAGALAAVSGPVVLVGADTPHMAPEVLVGAAEAVRDGGHVVVPSHRGGFSLYAAAAPWTDAPVWTGVFGAHDEVAVLQRLGARLMEPAVPDLDETSDLLWLQHHPDLPAPATLAVLQDLARALDDAMLGEATP